MQRAILPIVLGLVSAALVYWGMSSLMAAAGDNKEGGLSLTAIGVALFVGLFVAYIAGNLAGNRSVGKADKADRDQALTFTPSPGQARLYVYREGFIGSAAGLNVTLDGQPLSQLKSPRFLSVEATPGRHLLGANFGGLAGAQNNPSELILEFQPGEVVVVKAAVSMGAIKNTIRLDQQVLDDNLRRKLSGMKMVALTPA